MTKTSKVTTRSKPSARASQIDQLNMVDAFDSKVNQLDKRSRDKKQREDQWLSGNSIQKVSRTSHLNIKTKVTDRSLNTFMREDPSRKSQKTSPSDNHLNLGIGFQFSSGSPAYNEMVRFKQNSRKVNLKYTKPHPLNMSVDYKPFVSEKRI